MRLPGDSPIRHRLFSHWDDFAAKLERWVVSAVQQDVKLLVFPEYGSMELASLFGQPVYSDLQRQLQTMQTLLPKWRDLHQALARRHDVLIPDNGILVEGADDEVNWVFATLDLLELARIRAEG